MPRATALFLPGYAIDVEHEENEIIKTVNLALEAAGEAFMPRKVPR